MRWMILAAILFCVAGTVSAGIVATRDGKSYTGKVELKPGNQVRITSAGQAVTVPLADVARLSMATVPALPSEPGIPSLPLPWRHADIGRVRDPGDAAEKDGAFTLHGAGWGLWGPSDSAHVVYQPLTGDGDVIARIVTLPGDKDGFQAGLTVRQSLEPDAVQVAVMVHPGGIPHLTCRPIDGRGQSAPSAGARPHPWLRLVRAGDTFSAFCSADGQAWVPVGTKRVRMNERASAGLACAATANQHLAEASFDRISVRSGPMGPAKGLGLVDGSLIAGQLKRLDEKAATYVDPAGAERSIPPEQVACIFTCPLLPEVRSRPLAGKPRLCMANGDVMEAQIKGMSGGRVSAVSLVFGPQRLEMSKVAMVVLRPMAPAGSHLIYTRDGSIHRCTAMRSGEGALSADRPVLGALDLKASDIIAIEGQAE